MLLNELLRAAAAVTAVAAAVALSVVCGRSSTFCVELEPEPEPEPESKLDQEPEPPAGQPRQQELAAGTSLPQWPPAMPSPGGQVVPLPCRGEHADVAGAARTFNELGLCIAESLLPPEFAAECCTHAQQAFDELMHEMAARGIVLGEKTKGGFREIVKRTSGRYEMLYRTYSLPLTLSLCLLVSLCVFVRHMFVRSRYERGNL